MQCLELIEHICIRDPKYSSMKGVTTTKKLSFGIYLTCLFDILFETKIFSSI